MFSILESDMTLDAVEGTFACVAGANTLSAVSKCPRPVTGSNKWLKVPAGSKWKPRPLYAPGGWRTI
jgi:hypothetical protein